MDKRQRPYDEIGQDPIDATGPWRWRDMRSIGISIGFWPIEWSFGGHRWEDRFGGAITVQFEPVEFTLHYNDGSAIRAAWKE